MKNTISDVDKMLWIHCYCWFYEFLSPRQKKLFISLLDEFVNDMTFLGVGIHIRDDMKVTIAGWAVLLVLNRPLNINWYRHVESISIHPGKMLPDKKALGLIKGSGSCCLIHFAWKDIRDNATKATCNGNTILHEFAHALDHLNRCFDGFPELLLSVDEKIEWSKIFRSDFIHSKKPLRRKKLWNFFELGRWNKYKNYDSSCLDVGELFAVSTEMFFECPSKLRRITPDIYKCLVKLYRYNPEIDFPKEQ